MTAFASTAPAKSPATQPPGDGGGAAQAELAQRYAALMAETPNLRARDAAERLGISEAEFVAAALGQADKAPSVVRLEGDWGELVKALPKLGQVMILTRNEACVHEKVGTFDKITVAQERALVLDRQIDLRIFFGHWHSAFAVEIPNTDAEGKDAPRRSIQIFDLDGTAVFKIHLRPESDHEAFARLVETFRAETQNATLNVMPAVRESDRPDSEVDVEGLRARWKAMRDVHQFFGLLNDFKVGRHQALRLAGEDLTQPADPASFRLALEMAAEQKLSIMIFVGSPGVIQIHTGPVETLKAMGPWFNVLDPGFNLHLREDLLAEAWIVRKPTRDGMLTSLEIFDAEHRLIAIMFGEREPKQPENPAWRSLVESLPRLGALQGGLERKDA